MHFEVMLIMLAVMKFPDRILCAGWSKTVIATIDLPLKSY